MLLQADARHIPLTDGTVQCCVTSPPYWGLRDYGVSGQIGLERTPDEYVAGMVAVFREVRRVLREDGVLWLNLGDSYNNNPSTSEIPRVQQGNGSGVFAIPAQEHIDARRGRANRATPLVQAGVKKKDLIGIPWRVAFALQADGWYLRSDVIWHKPNPMPESVTDRPTKAHEYVFLLAKSERYFYDAKAISEPGTMRDHGLTAAAKYVASAASDPHMRTKANLHKIQAAETRNARTVWTIATQPYSGAHFATMPEALAERCILAGSRPGDLVLDPFGGSGTTARAAISLGRRAVVTEINPAYLALARERTQVTRGLPLEITA